MTRAVLRKTCVRRGLFFQAIHMMQPAENCCRFDAIPSGQPVPMDHSWNLDPE
jgi:hypothetical protein